MAQHSDMTISELGSLVYATRYADHPHDKPRNLFSTFPMSHDSKNYDMHNRSSPKVNGDSQRLYYRAEAGTIQPSVYRSANRNVQTNSSQVCQYASSNFDNNFVGDDGGNLADMARSFLPRADLKPSPRKSEASHMFRAPSVPKLRIPSMADKK